MLEIMVLTDGKVWGVEELFKVVEAQRHSLVDGLARAGRGFSGKGCRVKWRGCLG
jgi:hypothetical protein